MPVARTACSLTLRDLQERINKTVEIGRVRPSLGVLLFSHSNASLSPVARFTDCRIARTCTDRYDVRLDPVSVPASLRQKESQSSSCLGRMLTPVVDPTACSAG